MSRPDVESALARAETATPGDWYVATGCSWRRILRESDDRPVIAPTIARDGHPDLFATMADLEFVAESRTLVPDLARHILALEARVTAAEERAEEAERALANERRRAFRRYPGCDCPPDAKPGERCTREIGRCRGRLAHWAAGRDAIAADEDGRGGA